MGILDGSLVFAGRKIQYDVWEPGLPVMICEEPLCGIDSETTLIENSYEIPDVVVAGFYSGGRCQVVQWNHLREYLKMFLELNPKTKLVFFNLPFDVDVMGADIFIPELAKDGRMMELGANYRIYLIGTQGWLPGKVTLYDVTMRTLHVALNKEDGTRTSFSRDKPLTREQIQYLVCDCAATGMCGAAYNNVPTESIQARSVYVLAQMTRNGVRVDRDYLLGKIAEYTKRVGELSQELRVFGFRPKQDTDGMSVAKQLAAAAERIGVDGAQRAMDGVTRVNDGYVWSLAAILYNKVASRTALPSDLQHLFKSTLEMIVKGSIDWSKKVGKAMIQQAKNYLASQLQPIECDTCIIGVGGVKPRSVKPALKIIELLCKLYSEGKLTESMDAFNKEFYEEHEYFLGWLNLDGKKPISPDKFVQQHLIKLMKDNEGLQFGQTKGATKKIAKYMRLCGRKKENPDPAVLDSLSKYAYSSSDSWMLEDRGITDPFLNLYAEYKHAQKLLGTYFVTKYIEGDGRNHPRYDYCKVTGRTGSSGPNIQNYPQEPGLREQYIPADGHVFVACDYGQEEVITLAATLKHRYGQSRLADAVNLGIDVHSFFSLYREGKLNDLDISVLTPEIAAILAERSKPYKEELKDSRKLSKVFNFGCGGGMQGKTMYTNCRRQGFILTEEEAQALCDLWRDTWPEVKMYFEPPKDKIKEFKDDTKLPDNLFSDEDDEMEDDDDDLLNSTSDQVQTYRNCNILGMWRVEGSKNSILNFPFQSLAAVISKHALWLVFLDSLKRGYKPIIFIHDEIIAEVPEAIASEVADSIHSLMLQAAKDIIPDMLMKAEACIMRRWSKGAYEAYDKDGRMIPFEDAEQTDK